MSKCHAMQIAAADGNFLADNNWNLHIPASGRDRDGTTGAYLEIIIYSITLTVFSTVDPGAFGFSLYSMGSDTTPIISAFDSTTAANGATIHMTFPNGLPCGRPILDVGPSIAGSNGCYKLGIQQNVPSGGATIALDVQKCPRLHVLDQTSASEINATVTYGYAHQSALQP